MSDKPGLHLETLAISHGYDPQSGQGAAKPPIYATSTFVYRSAQQAKDIHEQFFDGPESEGAKRLAGEPQAYIYGRLGHPNLTMVEARLAALDGAEDAAAFNSGMAAISTTLFALVRPGDSVVHSRPFYGGADNLIHNVLSDFGVKAFAFLDGLSEASIQVALDEAAASGPVSVIWLESPANPTAALVDIALVVRLAKALGERQGRAPIVAVDNTFLGPLLQSPLAQGADLCMTSLTKYCAGHSDLLAGGVSGSAELIKQLKALRTLKGAHLDAQTAWLLLRSFETLPVRTARACDNALKIATYLRDHPKVRGVTYVGFRDEPEAIALLARQCRGTGSTFSVRLKGGEAECFRFLDRLRVLRLAVSLGGTETLICHPATTTHYAVPRAEREASGIDDGTMRLSVGLEHPDDLIADLEQALEAV
ncbi:cystathionine gamma-synthase family protein [Phenylobacterium aquaticum]|uniref:cystathionine gamma-synthase family protein n=3 Tax=Phenylobacterium aquaticum TaxID=1763816 RepID=UPI0026EDF539|nr:cystathionine gamma-synthase family protein [Phenylobacterium aquaticum]